MPRSDSPSMETGHHDENEIDQELVNPPYVHLSKFKSKGTTKITVLKTWVCCAEPEEKKATRHECKASAQRTLGDMTRGTITLARVSGPHVNTSHKVLNINVLDDEYGGDFDLEFEGSESLLPYTYYDVSIELYDSENNRVVHNLVTLRTP